MKLRCLLVDDEPPALKVLLSYMENIDDLQVVGTCYNALEAMQVLREQPVDVIFLDIKMPRLLGTEFIRTLRNPPKVIFTTAHKNFALEGFDLDAVDYLLKPFSFERFLRAVNKISPVPAGALQGGGGGAMQGGDGALHGGGGAMQGSGGAMQEEAITGAIQGAGAGVGETARSFLYFRVDRKMVRVELDQIVYIESLKDYSRIVRIGQGPLVMKKSISSIEQLLPDNQFIRIHRSFIISINKVTAFTQNDVEIGGQEIPIGKLYRHRLSALAKDQCSPSQGLL